MVELEVISGNCKEANLDSMSRKEKKNNFMMIRAVLKWHGLPQDVRSWVEAFKKRLEGHLLDIIIGNSFSDRGWTRHTLRFLPILKFWDIVTLISPRQVTPWELSSKSYRSYGSVTLIGKGSHHPGSTPPAP